MLSTLMIWSALMMTADPCGAHVSQRPAAVEGGFPSEVAFWETERMGIHWLPGLADAVTEVERFDGETSRLSPEAAAKRVCPNGACPTEPFVSTQIFSYDRIGVHAAVYVPRSADGKVGVLIAAQTSKEYHCTGEVDAETHSLGDGWVLVLGTAAPPRPEGSDSSYRPCRLDGDDTGCNVDCFTGRKKRFALLLHAPTGQVWDLKSPRSARRITVRDGSARIGRCTLRGGTGGG